MSLVKVHGRRKGLLHEQQKEDKGKCGPAAEWTWPLVTKDIEKAEVPNAFFASVKKVKPAFRNLKVLQPGGKCGAMNTFSQWRMIGLRNT